MLNNTKQILDKYNLRLDKNKSQNYLIDNNKLNLILENANIQPDETILEIGAGIGTLTIPMAKKAGKVIAIEKDSNIVKVLKQRIKDENIENIEVINEDALKIEYPSFDKVVSNLPYQISSPVTFKLLKYPFKKAILMYQLEFAERMQAKPGTKEYSRLTVALYFRADIHIIDIVPPNAFIPQPKVKSAIIELIPQDCEEPTKIFEDTTRALFQHRNKKVKKALIQSAHELKSDKKELKKKLNDVDDEILERKVFTLTPEEILLLSKKLEAIL